MISNIVAIAGVLVGVVGVIFGIIPCLKKKGIDTGKVLGGTDKVLEASKPLIQVAKTIPGLKPEAALLDWIEQKAKAGVKAAEQLGHAGSLKTNSEKFQAAQQTVYAALKEIGIAPTDNQKKLIDDFIQEAVNDLGHAPAPVAAQKAELQKTSQNLAKAQNENTQLRQKLTIIQSASQIAQSAPAQPAIQPKK